MEKKTFPEFDTTITMTYGNGKFVGMSYSGLYNYKIVSSDDGTNWKMTNLSTGVFYRFIICGNGKFIALGNQIAISTDLENWTIIPRPTGMGNLSACSYVKGKFIAASEDSIASSSDGINWSISKVYGDWGDIAYGNGKFIVKELDMIGGLRLTQSIDGVNWAPSVNVSYAPNYCTFGGY